MSYQEHLKTCSFCSKRQQSQKPTIKIKGASSYRREKRREKLAELASIIKGTSYSSISYPESFPKTKAKGASSINNNPNQKPKITIRLNPTNEKQKKLKELGKMIRDR